MGLQGLYDPITDVLMNSKRGNVATLNRGRSDARKREERANNRWLCHEYSAKVRSNFLRLGVVVTGPVHVIACFFPVTPC